MTALSKAERDRMSDVLGPAESRLLYQTCDALEARIAELERERGEAQQRDQEARANNVRIARVADTALAEGASLREALTRLTKALRKVELPETGDHEAALAVGLAEQEANDALKRSPLSALAAKVIEAAKAQAFKADSLQKHGLPIMDHDFVQFAHVTNEAVRAMNAELAK